MKEQSEIEKIHKALEYLSEQIDVLNRHLKVLTHTIKYHNQRLIRVESHAFSPERATGQLTISRN